LFSIQLAQYQGCGIVGVFRLDLFVFSPAVVDEFIVQFDRLVAVPVVVEES